MRELLLRFLLGGSGYVAATAFLSWAAARDTLSKDSVLARRTLRLPVLAAMLLAPVTATPVPAPLAVAAVVSLGAWLLLSARPTPRAPGASRARERERRAAALATTLCCALAAAHEASWALSRPGPHSPCASLVVLGDSLASGGFGESAPWPERLGLPVTNLSQPSETVAQALAYQVPELAAGDPSACALVAIGGNDVLGETPAADFEASLDQLLAAVSRGGRQVTMLELPLLPGRQAFGGAQRRVALRHGVRLVPRHVLLDVLASAGATSDGLHLTDGGHARLARALTAWLGLRGPAVSPGGPRRRSGA